MTWCFFSEVEKFKSMISNKKWGNALGYNEKRILNSELEGLSKKSLYAATDIKKMNILQRKTFQFYMKWFKTNDIYDLKIKSKKIKKDC